MRELPVDPHLIRTDAWFICGDEPSAAEMVFSRKSFQLQNEEGRVSGSNPRRATEPRPEKGN